jgi:hypothetical protein
VKVSQSHLVSPYTKHVPGYARLLPIGKGMTVRYPVGFLMSGWGRRLFLALTEKRGEHLGGIRSP